MHKKFLRQSAGKVSAAAFLQAQKEFLSGIPEAVSILARLEKGELYPTPALKLVQEAVLQDLLRVPEKKQEAKATRQREKVQKPINACIYDAKGGVLEEMGFYMSGEASRWVDRKLDAGPPGCRGVIDSKITNKDGSTNHITVEVDRDEAIGRMAGKRSGPVMKERTFTSDFKLMATRPTKVNFSHG
ncbi:MAG: hypothetical protein EBT07_09085 [Actinobacteria bacterium]|nr:hypothetical protein [Actinomycetota bacterium]